MVIHQRPSVHPSSAQMVTGAAAGWKNPVCYLCQRFMIKPFIYRLTRLNHFAPEQMSTSITHGVFDCFLLEGTPSGFVHEQRDYGELVLDDVQVHFGEWMRGQMRGDRLCIGFFRELECPCWINGLAVETPDLQLYSERAELACRVYPQSRFAVIQVPRATLERAAKQHLGHPVWLPTQGMVNLQPEVEDRRDVNEAFDLCCNLMEKGGTLAEQGMSILLHALVRAIRGSNLAKARQDERRCQQALQMVKLSELYLAAHLSESYSSEEFARAVGMSERSLELQFKKIFGMSPKKWRQYMGLNIANRKLGRASDRAGVVAEVAAACGFSHAGRFSALYRDLFGELPVRTRQNERHPVDQQGSIFRSFVY